MNFNKLIMVGNLTRDPEQKQFGDSSVTKFTIAVNGYKTEVCFIDVDVWGVQAAACAKYLKKASKVLVEGRIKLDNWTDKDGKQRSKHSIHAEKVVFLSTKDEPEQENGQINASPAGIPLRPDTLKHLDINDDLPF